MREEDHATVEREVCELAALRHPTFCVAVEAGRRESDVITFAFLECSKPVLLSSTAWGEGEGGAVLVGSSLCSFGYDVWHPARRPLLSLSLSLSLSLHTTRSYSLATPWSMRRPTLFSLSCHLRFAPHVAGFHTTFPGVRTCHFTSPSSYTTKEPPSLLCPVDAHAGLRVEGRGAEQGADQGRSAAEARQPRPSLFGSVLQTNLG